MHELAITESILSIAQKHAIKAQAVKVTAINITVGRLSSIVDDSVQFYWDFVSQNTICAGAKLQFTRIPAQLSCLDCGSSYTLIRDLTVCPTCGSSRVKVVSGEEFYLDSIEVEK